MRGAIHRLSAVLVSLAIAELWPAATMAEPSGDGPGDLRAAIVYNIIRFVDFPVDESSRLIMCIVRGADGASHLTALHGQRVGTRTIAARFVDLVPTEGCNVVYLGRANTTQTARASRRGVLLMGEAPSFIRSGGYGGPRPDGKQIRFEINTRNAGSAGLSISSKLLRLAARVQQ